MRRLATFLTLLLFLTTPALAEVVIKLSTERIHIEPAARTEEKSTDAGFFETAEKGMGGDPFFWFVPYTIDDSDPTGDTTIFSVRNDNFLGTEATATIEYYNDTFDLLTDSFLVLDDKQLAPISTRLVAGLVESPGMVNLGAVRIGSTDALGVDFFQVDFGENFASGDRAYVINDFCATWRARFLKFPGTTGGTILSLLINGPQGSDEEDPPTILGEVFSQDGDFINNFEVRTDLWFLELDTVNLVLPNNDFGTMVLQLNTTLDPEGLVFERHSAFSQFSLGVKAVCTDLMIL